ncbi:MAG: hypothetical protein ACFFCS_19765 [Candidatus Hodarchaeota archaeon]
MNESSSVANLTLDWSGEVLPSNLLYGLQENRAGLSDLDEVEIATSSPIVKTRMDFSDLFIENFTYMLETFGNNVIVDNPLQDIYYFQQIKVPTSSYIQWTSLLVQYAWALFGGPALNWTISIFNATEDTITKNPIPHVQIPNSSISFNPEKEGVSGEVYTAHWENITMPNVLLNANETYFYQDYAHFFISVLIPSDLIRNSYYFYCEDSEGFGIDSGLVYKANKPLGSVSINGSNDEQFSRDLKYEIIPDIDLTLITELIPVDPSPKPVDISLRVNGELVNGTEGNYTSNDIFKPVNGQVKYFITSAWSDIAPGTLSYDLKISYIIQEKITPILKVIIQESTPTITWNVSFDINYPRPNGNETCILVINLPHSWVTVGFHNISGGGYSSLSYSVEPFPTGKFQLFSSQILFNDSVLLTCESQTIEANLSLLSSILELNENIDTSSTIPGGPNGKNASLRSDYEGGIYNFTTLMGHANGTLNNTINWNDNKSIRFTNNTGLADLWAIVLQYLSGIIVSDYHLNNTFDLFIEPTIGFRENNLQNIEVVFNHESFNETWWVGNITGMDMPENPSWNISTVKLDNVVFTLLLDDNYTIDVNYTYNDSGNHYSDLFMNYSCVMYDNQTEILREEINTVIFELTTNFTDSENNISIFLKNQSSGKMVKLNATQRSPGSLNGTRLYWDSMNELNMTNITEFISPNRNTFELMIRVINTTFVDTSNLSDCALDLALLGFTYENTIKNYTLRVYNWTAGNYSSQELNFSGQSGKVETRINLNETFSDLESIFNNKTKSIRVVLEAVAELPLLNLMYWDLDRIMMNATFTDYQQCVWYDLVTNEVNELVYSNATFTLFDSPTNNFSSSIPVMDFLDFFDGYAYELLWTNGTDIAVNYTNFSVNRIPMTVMITNNPTGAQVIEGNILTFEAAVEYTTNGSRLANASLVFNFHVTYDTGFSADLQYSVITGQDGLGSVNVEIPAEWMQFVYNVTFIPAIPQLKSDTEQSSIVSVITQLEYVGIVLKNNALTLAIIATVIILMIFAKVRLDKKKRGAWNRDAEKIRDITKIQHMLIIAKSSGACVVDRAYSRSDLDADLVSGFLTAIASFGQEVGERSAKGSGDAILFDYQNFKILIQDGKQARGAIILDGVPTDNLRDNLKYFMELFEQKYELSTWKGNLNYFTGVDNLIEQAFEITLIYPLVVNPNRETKDIKSRLGKSLIEVAQATQKEKGVFYLSTLLNFAAAGRRESKNQVLSEIYHLKNQNYLTFYNPNAKKGT